MQRLNWTEKIDVHCITSMQNLGDTGDAIENQRGTGFDGNLDGGGQLGAS